MKFSNLTITAGIVLFLSRELGSGAPLKNIYTLPPLPYAYNALEPAIDQETMKLHHDKHHAAYVANLNEAVNSVPELRKRSLEDMLKNLSAVPASVRTAIQNNGGGHYNHSFFWMCMSPDGGELTPPVKKALEKQFKTIEGFEEQFSNAAKKVFGSGWAWLCMNHSGDLVIITTSNQDTPLEKDLIPLLVLDVWEHAYYLKYHNVRPDYISAWWDVVNWKQVDLNYKNALKIVTALKKVKKELS